MKITYDPDADAMYIYLLDRPVRKTRQITPNFILDFDEAGEVTGIEVLSVRATGIQPLTVDTLDITNPLIGNPTAAVEELLRRQALAQQAVAATHQNEP